MRFISLLICLVIIVDPGGCTFINGDLKHAVLSAVHLAETEMLEQQALNKALFKSGIDGDKHRFDHKRMLSMFQVMKKSRKMDENIAEMLLRATQELTRILRMPLVDLQKFHDVRAKWLAVTSPLCKPRHTVCSNKALYRTIDGSCNNRKYHTWGMSDRYQRRLLPPAYEDGISVPRKFSETGVLLPSPRLISNMLHSSAMSDIREPTDTVMVMQWGQLLDHDILDTPVMQGHDGASITCCGLSRYKHRPACFPINVPQGDKYFNTSCMNLVRSAPATRDDCMFGVRNQLNQASSYIDAGYLYGADIETSKQLRTFKQGLLKMTRDGMFSRHEDQHNCVIKHKGDYCMKSGDERLHVVPGLAATQMLLLREHNRIASILGRVNVHWNDEKIYQETRKIIIAINQHIAYNEYLPKILGKFNLKKFGLVSKPRGFNTVYNPSQDATISNVFGAAAFRFGHSQITNTAGMVSYNMSHTKTAIEKTFNKPSMLFTNKHSTDDVNRWLCHEKGGKSDRFLVSGVRDKLFLDEDGKSFDLAALNIQRGRDHGIQGYNAWREWCGLPAAFHFDTGPGGLIDMDKSVAEILRKIYRDPSDIDLFSGGLSERHVHGGRMGPTFACIVGRQFANLKHGDRFWYENNFRQTGFTEAQLNEIKKIRLSHVICRNTDILNGTPDAFTIKHHRNPPRSCSSYRDINFKYWRSSRIKLYHPPFVPTMHIHPFIG